MIGTTAIVRQSTASSVGWPLSLLLGLFVALIAILAGTTSSAQAAAEPENRVWAYSVGLETLLRPLERITAGQQLEVEPSNSQIVVATGVAAKSDGWLGGKLATRNQRGSIGSPGNPHNELNAASRGVDVDHVWTNGDLYTQVRGEQTRLVRVLSRGNGQNEVVIRELDGTPVTSMVISDESLAARIADGRWR